MAGYLVILPYYHPKTMCLGFKEAKIDRKTDVTKKIGHNPPKILQIFFFQP
jgi:hypothetical protein